MDSQYTSRLGARKTGRGTICAWKGGSGRWEYTIVSVSHRTVALRMAPVYYTSNINYLLVDKITDKMVYHARFHSTKCYGIAMWGHSPFSLEIFKIQKLEIRIVAGKD